MRRTGYRCEFDDRSVAISQAYTTSIQLSNPRHKLCRNLPPAVLDLNRLTKRIASPNLGTLSRHIFQPIFQPRMLLKYTGLATVVRCCSKFL